MPFTIFGPIKWFQIGQLALGMILPAKKIITPSEVLTKMACIRKTYHIRSKLNVTLFNIIYRTGFSLLCAREYFMRFECQFALRNGYLYLVNRFNSLLRFRHVSGLVVVLSKVNSILDFFAFMESWYLELFLSCCVKR